MDIEAALVAGVKANSGVQAVIGTRFYPMVLPSGVTFPAATYQMISSDPTNVHGGGAALRRPRFQITAWGSTLSSALSAANAIHAVLDGFRGTWGTTPNTKTIFHSLFADKRHDYSPEVGLTQVQHDYFILHEGD